MCAGRTQISILRLNRVSHPPQAAVARRIAATLSQAGFEVYLVGGCVRDRLLGRDLHDLDLTTSARPADIAALFPAALEVGVHFGVMLVHLEGVEVQVATFRTEDSYLDGRRPDRVCFETDVRLDVARRDFTINTLLEDPFTGEIIDHTGGRADLDARLIRAVGDPMDRFAEDHLRMLRAVRFAARLGFAIEPGTMAAIQRCAPRAALISPERVRDEISRILTEGQARRGFELLDQSGLLQVILPEAARMKGVRQPPEFHPEGDVWIHTLGLLERLECPSLELALACLLHDVGKPGTQSFEDRIRFSGHDRLGAGIAREILARLRFPSAAIDAVCSMVAQHMKFKDAPKMTDGAFKRFARQGIFDELLELHRIDLLASQRPLDNWHAVSQRRASIPGGQLRPAPLLRGRDLLQLGYPPGPRFSRILDALEEEQLEGRVTSRDQALEWLNRTFG
ncbi:MAG: CCA tRNA nucleotidyltransferase [Candidatus Solibacter usitatus]|nr:CCA tRNA nucleotidyltransferase [Candidatus Solibacter usitatus]